MSQAFKSSARVSQAIRSRATSPIINGANFGVDLKSNITDGWYQGDETFSRASAAIVQDFEGLLKEVPNDQARFEGARFVENLATFPEDFSNAAWTKSNTTATATTLLATAVNATTLQTYTGIGDFTLRVKMSRITGTGDIDLTVDGGSTWTTITLIGTDQVFSITQAAVTNPQFGIRLVTDTDKINATEIQIEKVSGQANQNPSEYVSSSIFFKHENSNTVSSNVVTEAKGADIAEVTLKGYLAEKSSTNKCTNYNANVDAALTNVGVSGGTPLDRQDDSSNFITAIKSICSSKFVLHYNNNTGSSQIITFNGFADNTNKHSVSARVRFTGTAPTMQLSFGEGAIACLNSYAKTVSENFSPFFGAVELTFSVPNGTELWCVLNQLEESIYATSEIITEGASASRAVDDLNYPYTGNLQANDCSGHVEWTYQNDDGSTVIPIFACGSSTDYLYISYDPSANVITVDKTISSTSYTATEGLTPVVGTTYKISWRLSSIDGVDVWVSGTKGTGDSNTDDWVLSDVIYMGADEAGLPQTGNVKNLRLYPLPLADAQLADLTA